jgi:quercetin dioxygenase-like cupin family protein
MTHELKGFITIPADEIPFTEDNMLTLPKGVKSKILAQNKDGTVMDIEVQFPPGYVEPRHTHKSSHADVILDGKMLIEGKVLLRGGYLYAEPNVVHGPYSYPEGCMVFGHIVGASIAHKIIK